MRAYQRILVCIREAGEAEALLGTLGEVAAGRRPDVLVVWLVNPRQGQTQDGPAATLPGEQAARRAAQAMKRLELQLARSGLGWVAAKVFWRDPAGQLGEVVRSWRPDLVIAARARLPADLPAHIDVLQTAGRGALRRLADALRPRLPRHA